MTDVFKKLITCTHKHIKFGKLMSPSYRKPVI